MNDTLRFGTAGLADSYTVKKFDPAAIAAYTAGFGLTAFEYQCGRGVRLAHDKAAALGAACAERNIALSVHAPYYISMSSLEEDKRLHSIDYLLQSCALVKALGGRRVIFHSGSCGKQSREAALEKALDTMERAVKACDEAGYGDCILCPETMGKVNQLGTLDEVLALCAVDSRITPCIDFGHLYARSCGTQFAEATAAADYAALLDTLAERLGDDRAVHFHAHFSRIAYTKGGEKCHLTFADTAFGPPHLPLLQLLKARGLAPTIICESAGTQAEDAAAGLQALAALLDTLEATLTRSAIRPPLTAPVARITTVDVTWNPGLLEKCWPGLSLLAFGHAGVGTAGVRDLLDRLERGMAEDRWPGQQAPFKRALADALAQRGALDAALRANDPRAAHRASEALEDALTEMEDSLLAAGSGPKRKKPSLFRRLFGLR